MMICQLRTSAIRQSGEKENKKLLGTISASKGLAQPN